MKCLQGLHRRAGDAAMLARVQVLLMHLHMTLWLRVSARVGRVIQAAEMLVWIGEMLCCQWSLPPPRWKACENKQVGQLRTAWHTFWRSVPKRR